MKLSTMSKAERSLLLFLESRAVDHGGLVAGSHMNADDFAMAKAWTEAGFIEFGRIPFDEIVGDSGNYVVLSTDAWALAHEERRARNARLMAARSAVYAAIERRKERLHGPA